MNLPHADIRSSRAPKQLRVCNVLFAAVTRKAEPRMREGSQALTRANGDRCCSELTLPYRKIDDAENQCVIHRHGWILAWRGARLVPCSPRATRPGQSTKSSGARCFGTLMQHRHSHAKWRRSHVAATLSHGYEVILRALQLDGLYCGRGLWGKGALGRSSLAQERLWLRLHLPTPSVRCNPFSKPARRRHQQLACEQRSQGAAPCTSWRAIRLARPRPCR